MGRSSLASFLVCPKPKCRGIEITVFTIVEKAGIFVNGVKLKQDARWKTVGSRTTCNRCGHSEERNNG